MKKICYGLVMVCLLFLTTVGQAQLSDRPVVINLMLQTDLPTNEQLNVAPSGIRTLYGEIAKRNSTTTLFVTEDVASSDTRMLLGQLGLYTDFEFAISGSQSDENLSTKPYAEQKALLEKSIKAVENCGICGRNEIIAKGFMPQSFQQNQDTYKILDDLGIQYDAGFQAGVLYSPGHENDVWPYPVEGHKFYAVPVSTYIISGKETVLSDQYFKNIGQSSTQWYDALVGKFDEIQGKDEPMVILLNTSVSGYGDYLDAFKEFMDYAVSKKASFVTTAQLVYLAKAGVHDVSSLPTNVSSECLTCGQSDNNIVGITISTNETTQATNNTTQVVAAEN
jgi:hypothetical protein